MKTNTTPVLSAKGLVKRYGRVTALDHADFDLYPGEILAVIGDNGAGKSSLIKALSGAIKPDEGEILLDGKPVSFHSPMEARQAGIETVYQNLALSPALSIADNLFLGREIRRKGPLGSLFRMLDRGAMEKIAREKLSELGLMTIQNIGQAVETLRAASVRALRWRAPQPLAPRWSSWTSRRRHWASRNRAVCWNSFRT